MDWEPYDLHDLARVSWFGYALYVYRPCAPSHNGSYKIYYYYLLDYMIYMIYLFYMIHMIFLFYMIYMI